MIPCLHQVFEEDASIHSLLTLNLLKIKLIHTPFPAIPLPDSQLHSHSYSPSVNISPQGQDRNPPHQRSTNHHITTKLNMRNSITAWKTDICTLTCILR